MSVLTRPSAPLDRSRIGRLQGKARYAPTLATVGLFVAMFAYPVGTDLYAVPVDQVREVVTVPPTTYLTGTTITTFSPSGTRDIAGSLLPPQAANSATTPPVRENCQRLFVLRESMSPPMFYAGGC